MVRSMWSRWENGAVIIAPFPGGASLEWSPVCGGSCPAEVGEGGGQEGLEAQVCCLFVRKSLFDCLFE